MQKWHIHSFTGRGRPALLKPRTTITIVSSRDYFHITSPRAQEHSKQQILQDPPKPPSIRAKRLKEATSSLENLYLHSADFKGLGSGNRELIFRYEPVGGSPIDQPAGLASQHAGRVPPRRNIAKGTHNFRSSDGGRFTMAPGRSQSFPRDRLPTDQEGHRPAVDARSLGARSKGAQTSSLVRTVRGNNPPVETRGSSERSIFQSRRPQGDNDVQKFPPKERSNFEQGSPPGENGVQQRLPQEESSGYLGTQGAENPGQEFGASFSRGQTRFQTPTRRGEGRPTQPGRSRAGRSRTSRNSEDSQPRRRKRAQGSSDQVERNGRNQERWTEEEQEYLKEKEEQKSQKPLGYEPVEFSKEMLIGMGPATASDEWGMSEMLGERLVLARKHLNREFIQWDSKEQKADVMAVVEKLKAVRRAKGASPTTGSGDPQTQSLMQKLFAGEYAKFKRPRENDVLGHVERHVHRNDSFYPDDEKSLLEKVRSILPAEQSSNVRKGARKARRA